MLAGTWVFCELLIKLRRPEEPLPKTSLKLPTGVVRTESADERHELDGDQPACIEAALQVMAKDVEENLKLRGDKFEMLA